MWWRKLLIYIVGVNRSHCGVCNQNNIVGCVGVQVGEFLVVKANRSRCSVCSQNNIVCCVWVQIGELLCAEGAPMLSQCACMCGLAGLAWLAPVAPLVQIPGCGSVLAVASSHGQACPGLAQGKGCCWPSVTALVCLGCQRLVAGTCKAICHLLAKPAGHKFYAGAVERRSVC